MKLTSLQQRTIRHLQRGGTIRYCNGKWIIKDSQGFILNEAFVTTALLRNGLIGVLNPKDELGRTVTEYVLIHEGREWTPDA